MPLNLFVFQNSIFFNSVDNSQLLILVYIKPNNIIGQISMILMNVSTISIALSYLTQRGSGT